MAHEAISKAVDSLRRAAPGAKIILFGSHARGEATADSDLDFLVIEPQLDDSEKVNEMVRLRRAIGDVGVSVDVVVTSQRNFDYWAETPGHLYYEAAAEGRVLEPIG